MEKKFQSRAHAGRLLAQWLEGLRGRDPLVLALPPGGTPVAAEIAAHLGAPLDVVVVKKLGTPGREALGLGALVNGVQLLDHALIDRLGVLPEELSQVSAEAARVVAERTTRYRSGRPFPRVAGRTVILVDDGVATGATLRAVAQALRGRQPARVVAAIPVAPTSTLEELRDEPALDEVVCPIPQELFYGVARAYEQLPAVSDEEVVALLREAQAARAGAG